MFIPFITAIIAAFGVSFCCGFVVRKIGPKFGLIDKPGHRKVHDKPMPTGGGLAVWSGVVIPFAIAQLVLFVVIAYKNDDAALLWIPDFVRTHLGGLWLQSGKLWLLLGLGSILVVLGTLDDRFNLSWKLRIIVQIVVAIAAVCSGFRASVFIDFSAFTGFLSVVWIVMLINSFNMLDNMNGLSCGVALICSAFLAAVMLLTPDPTTNNPQFFVGGLLLVLIGAMLGFFCHNNPFRAKMFMGDGGAYFIGFMLACSTLTATFAGYDGRRETLFAPLLILAVPIYDTVSVVLIRLRQGRSPFQGDKSHFSHRLTDRGFSKPQSVLVIYLTTTICAAGSLLLYQVDFTGATLVFAQTVMILILIAILEIQK